MTVRCGRCGLPYYGDQARCIHWNTSVDDMSDEEAVRVQARWALSRECNPDHDTTDFRDRADLMPKVPPVNLPIR